jgi:hypothetical protein
MAAQLLRTGSRCLTGRCLLEVRFPGRDLEPCLPECHLHDWPLHHCLLPEDCHQLPYRPWNFSDNSSNSNLDRQEGRTNLDR